MFMHPTDPDLAVISTIDHRWTITCDPALGVWSAERRSEDGRHRRYIVARTGDELAGKVAAADVAGS